jgi:hypothetical protein
MFLADFRRKMGRFSLIFKLYFRTDTKSAKICFLFCKNLREKKYARKKLRDFGYSNPIRTSST